MEIVYVRSDHTWVFAVSGVEQAPGIRDEAVKHIAHYWRQIVYHGRHTIHNEYRSERALEVR